MCYLIPGVFLVKSMFRPGLSNCTKIYLDHRESMLTFTRLPLWSNLNRRSTHFGDNFLITMVTFKTKTSELFEMPLNSSSSRTFRSTNTIRNLFFASNVDSSIGHSERLAGACATTSTSSNHHFYYYNSWSSLSTVFIEVVFAFIRERLCMMARRNYLFYSSLPKIWQYSTYTEQY